MKIHKITYEKIPGIINTVHGEIISITDRFTILKIGGELEITIPNKTIKECEEVDTNIRKRTDKEHSI